MGTKQRSKGFAGLNLQHGPPKSELLVMVHPPPSPGHEVAEVVVVVVDVVVIVTVDSIQLQSVLRNPPPSLEQLLHTEHAPVQVPDAAVVVVVLVVDGLVVL